MAEEHDFFYNIGEPLTEPEDMKGYRSVGGWLFSPSQYETFVGKGLGDIEGGLYPAYMNPETEEPIMPPPPPLNARNLRERVELGGYYGSNMGFSLVGNNPILYYYPEAKSQFPSPQFPSTPNASFSAGYEGKSGEKSGYTGIARWEGRNIGMRGGTSFSQPEHYGNLLATGYSYPEGFLQ